LQRTASSRPVINDRDTPERSSTLLLVIATAAALVWANLSDSYVHVFDQEMIAAFTVRDVINDLLMTLFFLVVSLEIKHELTVGELSSARKAALPIGAALGGMLVPAAIYLAFNAHTPLARGWGTPMATDIAFTLGVMQLLGKRVPPALLIFVAALAIADDLGAVAVIAIFYNHQVDPVMLLLAGITAAAIYLQSRRLAAPIITVVLGLVLWWLIRSSGIHATIAGVVLGFVLPPRAGVEDPIADKLKEPVDWIVLPLFALANAGVVLTGFAGIGEPVFLGVAMGLLLGKPIGIVAFSALMVRTRLATLPTSTTWSMLAGAAVLCGIGFTMALFIAELGLAGSDKAFDSAKIGILVASVLAALTGYVLLRRFGIKLVESA
jgi:NhaA family Na+:H+ antiporter